MIYNLFFFIKQFNINIDFNNNTAIIDTVNLKLPNNINYDKDFRGSYYLIGSIYYLIQNDYSFKYQTDAI